MGYIWADWMKIAIRMDFHLWVYLNVIFFVIKKFCSTPFNDNDLTLQWFFEKFSDTFRDREK